MKQFCLILFLGIATGLYAQSLDFVGVWNDTSLPVSNGVRYNDVWGYTDCQENEYGIVGSIEKIHFIDLRNPANPTEIASFSVGGGSLWRDMKVYKNRAYAVSEDSREGLLVFNLVDLPNSVQMSNQIKDAFGSAHNIFIDVDNAKLYAVGTNTRSNGVIIYDLYSNLDQPTVIANIALPGGYVHDIYVKDNIAYCSHGNRGLYIYDFTIANSPVLLGSINSYPEKGYNHSSWVSPDDNYLVFADETHNTGLKFLDISDPSDLQVTDVFRSELLAPNATGSIAHNPFIRDGLIFVSYYHDGVQVFDYSDPGNVKQIAGYDTDPNNTSYSGFTGAWGTYPYFNSGLVLGSDVANGLFVLKMNGYDFEPIDFGNGPSLNLSTKEPELFLCNDSSVSITASSDDSSVDIKWFKNGQLFSNEHTISTTEEGDYFAEIQFGDCTIRSELVKVSRKPSLATNLEGDQNLCPNTTIEFTFTGEAEVYTFFDGEDNVLQTGSNPTLTIDTEGIYYGVLEGEGCISTSSSFQVEAVTPEDLSIQIINGVLRASEALSYQWFMNGTAIEEAVERYLFVVQPGSYHVEAIDLTTGCLLKSEVFTLREGELLSDFRLDHVQFYFAPESKTIKTQFISTGKPLMMHLYDAIGREVFSERVQVNGVFSKSWGVSHLSSGIYFFGMTDGKKTFYKKIHIQVE